jgi:hypothetical protein
MYTDSMYVCVLSAGPRTYIMRYILIFVKCILSILLLYLMQSLGFIISVYVESLLSKMSTVDIPTYFAKVSIKVLLQVCYKRGPSVSLSASICSKYGLQYIDSVILPLTAGRDVL